MGYWKTTRRAVAFALLAMGLAQGAMAQEIIVDNGSPGFTQSGGWGASANTGFYGTNSLINFASTTGTDVATWPVTIATPGDYDVYAWWVASGNRAPAARYTVNHSLGSDVVTANQTLNGSRWNLLGRFNFAAGAKSISLSDQGPDGSYVSADAVRLVYAGGGAVTPCLDPVTAPSLVTGSGGCSTCTGHLLPGAVEPRQDFRYAIHSDLPELFGSPGVLYTTGPVIPENTTTPLPLSVRTQTTNGFTTIDDNFEVFIFHITQPGDGTAIRRMVIHVKNDGAGPVTINPRQVIITDGQIGNVHEMESNLGRRVMDEEWDTPIPTITIPAGGTGIVAYGKRFAGFPNGPDLSANVNCFGIVRADVINTQAATAPTRLTVSVVAIPGGNISQNLSRADAVINQGAENREGTLDLTRPPQGCEIGRACGVVQAFQWRSEVVTIDTAAVPPGGYTYRMGLPQKQTTACPLARQTSPMLRHPGYAPNDTVGNYMTDYRVHFRFVNRNPTTAKAVDLEFGSDGADIGLGYKLATTTNGLGDEAVDALPTRTLWAGPNQSARYKSLTTEDGGAVTVAPCGTRHMDVRFQILGNSSLPFSLRVVPATAAAVTPSAWLIQ